MAAYAEESPQAPGEQTESQAAGSTDQAAPGNDAQDSGQSGQQEASSQQTEQTQPPAEQSTETQETETTEATEETADGQADSEKVVTLGENLNDSQRASMYEYFGTSPDKVKTIVVTHADEVKYMEGIATAQQIGATTNSCAYVEPTNSGGIKVKTANLNFVTSAMIASTLTTAGMENCNVIAACPFEVSGTGALTGIIMAYENASRP